MKTGETGAFREAVEIPEMDELDPGSAQLLWTNICRKPVAKQGTAGSQTGAPDRTFNMLEIQSTLF